nr:transporter [Pseudomonas panipatensis]
MSAHVAAQGAPAAPPPSVSQPTGINLGVTSFFDGFAGPPGWTYLAYLRTSSATSIRDNQGKNIAAFDDPEIQATVLLNQVSYISPATVGLGAHLGWNAIIPITSVDATFGSGGPQLKDNATGLGDLTTGPQVQFDPIIGADGNPVFSQRFAFDMILPVGKYDKHKDINQGSNHYSLNPYWAGTWLPAPKFEVSWRLHYLYNFKNDDPASSTPQYFEGAPVKDVQAGQAAWANFTTSYEVAPKVHVGINGYYFKQLTDDRANGHRLEDSREKVLGVGPGLFWAIDQGNGLWVNTYREFEVENRARNDYVLQVRFGHAF